MRFISPLRYPGGKARLAPFLSRVLSSQTDRPIAYGEPFAGGAGAALHLLVGEHVRHIYINDLNPGIAAFWRTVFQEPKALANKVLSARIDIEAWKEHKATYDSASSASDLELGFATFFLNRCNRSGIISARPIGGLKQTGRWKLDARFNREDLANRILVLGSYASRVSVTELDAKAFISRLNDIDEKILLYVDPPYLREGEDLYLNALSEVDHQLLAIELKSCKHPWVATYDVDRRVADDYYKDHRIVEYNISHTAHIQHIGVEYMIFSRNLQVPVLDIIGQTSGRWLSA